MMRKGLEILGWLTALLIFAFASHAVLAQTASPARDARGAQDSVSRPEAKRARRISDEEEISPASIVRSARTLYVRPSSKVDKKYLEYKLQKHTELREWGLMIVEEERVADLVLKVDQTRLNYIFSITDPQTSIVVLSGKVVAINDAVAAEYLGKEIVKKMREARASATERQPSKRKSRRSDDFNEDEESESPQ